MIRFLCVHLLCLFGHLGKAALQFLFLNAASSPVSLYWLKHGEDDHGDGMLIESLVSGNGVSSPGLGTVKTSKGHTFRLELDGRRSKAFAHDGAAWNVVGIRRGLGEQVQVELLGAKELRRLVHNSSHELRLPKLRIRVPENLVEDLVHAYSPELFRPKLLSTKGTCDGSGGAIEMDNEMVLLSSVATPLEINWMSAADDLNEYANKLEDPVSTVGVLTPAAAASCFTRIQAHPNQVFFVSSPSGLTPRRESAVFLYPGEFSLVGVVADESSAASMKLEILNEDELKILMNKFAMACGHVSEEKTEFKACFERSALLPTSRLRLPASMSYQWFERLWIDLSNWRLCNYQSPTTPVDHLYLNTSLLSGGYRELQADVLRKDPLVMAVHSVLTAEECNELTRFVGSDLRRAKVSGNKHIKSRRTLSKQLYPDWSDHSSILTQSSALFFEVARQASGYKLYPPGQEPLYWLFYKPGYEYRAHCDGEGCGASETPLGKRVATSLVYCKVADEGGGTVFPVRAPLKLEPSPGMMLFFAYNPDPRSDTRHAACPVLRGEKTTATQWYREGVSEKVNWAQVEKGVVPKQDVLEL